MSLTVNDSFLDDNNANNQGNTENQMGMENAGGTTSNSSASEAVAHDGTQQSENLSEQTMSKEIGQQNGESLNSGAQQEMEENSEIANGNVSHGDAQQGINEGLNNGEINQGGEYQHDINNGEINQGGEHQHEEPLNGGETTQDSNEGGSSSNNSSPTRNIVFEDNYAILGTIKLKQIKENETENDKVIEITVKMTL